MKLFKITQHFISPHFAETIDTISTIIVFAAFYPPMIGFHPSYVQPELAQITTPRTIEPAVVRVGFYLHDFMKFDTTNDDFIVNGKMWFKCDLKKVPLDKLSGFRLSKGSFLIKSEPTVIQLTDSQSVVSYTVRAHYKVLLNFTRFPLDDHFTHMGVENPLLDGSTVIFQSDDDDFQTPKDFKLEGWDIIKKRTEVGFVRVKLPDENDLYIPKIRFCLDIAKKSWRQTAIISFPLMLFCSIAVYSLSIPPISGLNLSLTSLVGATTYSYVIYRISPVVSKFMLADYMFLFFMFYIFILFLINILGIIMTRQHYKPMTIHGIRGLCIVTFYVTFLMGWIYLTNFFDVHIWF